MLQQSNEMKINDIKRNDRKLSKNINPNNFSLSFVQKHTYIIDQHNPIVRITTQLLTAFMFCV